MAKKFKPELEPYRLDKIPTPHKQKDGYKKDGTPRRAKWKIKAIQGVVPANQYVYWYYHDDYVPNKDYVPIFLDDNPLNTNKDNIVLISTRELKNLVHFNINNFVSGDADLQSDAINLTKLHIALKDITKEVKNNEK